MSEQGNTLSYALTPNLGRSAKSVAVKRYSAQMKSTGTFGDAELQEALASESKVSVEQFRYLEAVRRRIIENALRNGKKVFISGIAVVSGLRGSFSSVDGSFDPKKHKLAVTSYTYGDFQNCLKGAVPENTVKGGTPTLSRINEAGQEDEAPGLGERHGRHRGGRARDGRRGVGWWCEACGRRVREVRREPLVDGRG